MNAKEKAQRRWWRFPVDVPFTAEFGEDVEKTPLSREEFEELAAGPLDQAVGKTRGGRGKGPCGRHGESE